MNDAQLLQSFAEHGSETAFRALVERHLPLVFGTARRITADSALAEEVAQTVFILLARKARSLRPGTILSGWLYRASRFVATRALLAEQRRRRREQEAVTMQLNTDSDSAWQRVAPRLDAALGRLGETDRNALLLRYFEERPIREVGALLGVSEEAAKKRVARALEKLRRILSRRGTEVSAAALAAGLTHECAEAASAITLAPKVSAVVAAHLAAGSGIVAGGSALLADVLAAWRWAKIKAAFVGAAGAIVVALLLPPLLQRERNEARSAAPTLARETSASLNGAEQTADNSRAALESNTIEIAGQTIPLRSLRVTVLEAQSDRPIPDAEATHTLMGLPGGGIPLAALRADSNGTLNIRIPERLPGGERMDYFEVSARAEGYAPRTIHWLSTTGNVIATVSTQYTVSLEPGITLSGTVVDDTGQSLAGVRIGALGNNYRGYTINTDTSGKVISPPEVRAEDFPSFFVSSENSGMDAVVTDSQGRFRFNHFPSDLRALVIDLIGTDGARRKFRTPLGNRLTADELPEVSFEDLKNGTARLVIPRGVNVEGLVVNALGDPVVGATVVEGIGWGNLKELSRTETDVLGHFRLINRPPREIILAASAEGYASSSIVVQLKPGVEEVRIQLPSEQPLRGRVVNEVGQPLGEASVTVPDYFNDGLGITWSDKTDGAGRFVWRGAPANEVALAVNASGYASRLVRVRASGEESLITLRPGNGETVRVTGKVTDAESGTPMDRFHVKISHDMWGTGQEPAGRRTVEGSAAHFDLEISKKEIRVGTFPAWVLQVEADGYEATFTRIYYFEEGDQHLDIALQRGGTVEGVVQSPNGAPAANAQLALASEGNSVLSGRPGELSRQDVKSKSDIEGRFRLTKPPKSLALVVFHDSGWAITPIPPGAQPVEIQLLPWARIEGTVARGETPIANEEVGLNKLTWDWSDALSVLHNTTTDEEGRFVFDKVPAGEFVLSWQSWAWHRGDQPTVKALETPVTVRAGESRTVMLSASGRAVLVRLRAPSFPLEPAWTNALPMLSRDVNAPPEPVRNDYTSNASHMAARHRYAHDPVVLAALREMRNYVGHVTANGIVTFQDIPPGRYVLDVKLFTPSAGIARKSEFEENPVQSRVRVAVSVPEKTGTSEDIDPVFVGEFTLEPL